MLPQANNIIENPSIISDNEMFIDKNSRNYIIKFTNGDKTFQYFKKLYTDNDYDIIIFFVENFELFNNVFAIFRYCNFVYINLPKNEEKNVKYLKFEKQMRKENKLECNNNILKKSYELAYYPDIYRSIITSINNPISYLNYGKCPESLIYNEIQQSPKTIDELGILNIKDIENKVKSLLFVGVIVSKGNKLHINTL
ncbi:hypothetical protein BDAP_000722 [Binucleata daphniae]